MGKCNYSKLDILWLVCVYLLCASIPFDMLIKNDIACGILRCVALLAFCIFLIVYSKKNKIFVINPISKFNSKYLLCLPFYLVCFCNIVFLLIDREYCNTFNVGLFIIDVFKYLFVAFAEEMLFRYFLMNKVKEKNRIVITILLSAAFFSLMHIVNFFSGYDIVSTLIQMAYTFGIGLICALIYCVSENIILPIIFHFLYNIFNDTLFLMLYDGDINTLYIIVIAVFVGCSILYGVLVYLLEVERKCLKKSGS